MKYRPPVAIRIMAKRTGVGEGKMERGLRLAADAEQTSHSKRGINLKSAATKSVIRHCNAARIVSHTASRSLKMSVFQNRTIK